MPVKVAIIGAGIIGASIALALTRAGAQVTVIEGAQPASDASGRSFGWINASFHADRAHFNLRSAGIAAYHRLAEHLPDMAVAWPGCLWWEEQGKGLEDMKTYLKSMEYPVECIDKSEIERRAPLLSNMPDAALLFPGEGVAEAGVLTGQLLRAVCAQGAQLVTGCMARNLTHQGGKITGIQCNLGHIAADHVVVAAGNGSAQLMQDLGLTLPMLTRPGALVYTRPQPPILPHIMVSPDLEFRQDPTGRIIAPYSASHQADNSEVLGATPAEIGADTLARLQRLMPQVDLAWDSVSIAMRPVPGDGMPVVGACGPDGLYLAVMHSGVTLAAIIGELVSAELLAGETADLLHPYRPARFH